MAKTHVVRQGDCISSIAEANGLFPDTLWDHPSNAELRRLRGNPNVLCHGDVVCIPDLREKKVSCAVDRVHRFKRRGVPEKLRIVILNEGEPRAGVSYVLIVDGVEHPAVTGADGLIEQWIPNGAKHAELVIGTGEAEERFVLAVGHLAPISEVEGVRSRLVSLGYLVDGADASRFAAAVRDFQLAAGLEPSGEVDDATREALVEHHGA